MQLATPVGQDGVMGRRLFGAHGEESLEGDVSVEILFDEVEVAGGAYCLVDVDEVWMGRQFG